MAPLTSVALILGGLASLVTGHGYLKSITVNGENYLAWQVGQDDYVTPTPVRYARKLADNGPVPDFTSNNVTYAQTQGPICEATADYQARCGAGGNIPAEGVIELKAGDTVYEKASSRKSRGHTDAINFTAPSTGTNGAALTAVRS